MIASLANITNQQLFSDRLELVPSQMEEASSKSHGTITTNVAAGDTLGVAPEAKVWVYSPDIVSEVSCAYALEKICKREAKKEERAKNHKSQAYYSVLNFSGSFCKATFNGTDAEWKTLKENLSDMFCKVRDKGVFTVHAAGNDGVGRLVS